MHEFHHQTEDKLIILYVLNKIKTGLSREQIAYIIIQNLQISYIDIQMYLDDLNREGLILEKTADHPSSQLMITPDGIRTLDPLMDKIPQYIREMLDVFILNNKKKIYRETDTTATYEQTGPDDFQVYLSLCENNIELMTLSINSPSKEGALAICDNWKNNTQKVYAAIMKSLV